MKLGLPLAGAVLGGVLAADSGAVLLGAMLGAAIGVIAGYLRQLNQRLARLEILEEQRAPIDSAPAPRPRPEEAPPAEEHEAQEHESQEHGAEEHRTEEHGAEAPTADQPATQPAGPALKGPEPPPLEIPPLPPPDDSESFEPHTASPSLLEKLAAAARDWLTTGNVPVKVGVIVSFFGVAFLLKYSIDRQLLVVPIEIRLLLVAIAALGLLALGWRLRERSRVYALSLQGGGVGILYLTIFAAFRLYDLIPSLAAFLLLVALTGFAGLAAVLQNARALAVLGAIGGFLAPVLVSTGSGNHVALFTYYLVLNSAILGIARYRPWRELNLIGFFFTFIVGTLWGRENYRPELFASTEPFLVAHFLLYQAVAVLFALQQGSRLKGLVDGTLVFGTPVIAFALQAELVRDTEYGLAISALVVAVFYALLTRWLWQRHREQLKTLSEAFLSLAVAFATIAIPLALDARWTSASWALEGLALVWVGCRQGRVLAKVAGFALLVAAGVSFAIHGWQPDAGIPVLNGNFLGGLLIAGSALAASRLLSSQQGAGTLQRGAAAMLFLWGGAWWLGSGVREVEDRTRGSMENHLFTLWFAASCWLGCELGRRLRWSAARFASLAHLPLQIGSAMLYSTSGHQPFAGWGAIVWIAATIVQGRVLHAFDDRPETARWWHSASALALTALLSWQLHTFVGEHLNQIWAGSFAYCLVLAVVAIILGPGQRIAWPIARHWDGYLFAAGALSLGGLFALWSLVAGTAGTPEPLPYVPLLNPLDLTTLLGLLAAAWWLTRVRGGDDGLPESQWKAAAVYICAFAFLLTTIGVVRGVVQLSGTAWQPGAMSRLVSVQAALSIYWGLLGVAGMVAGARRKKRWIWLVGAALMGLVVVKLFIVDLGNSETVARIVSFIGVGLLLLVVGYFAPAPPRSPDSQGGDE